MVTVAILEKKLHHMLLYFYLLTDSDITTQMLNVTVSWLSSQSRILRSRSRLQLLVKITLSLP